MRSVSFSLVDSGGILQFGVCPGLAMSGIRLSLALAFLFVVSAVGRHHSKFRNFDEYLLYLEKRQQTILVQEIEIFKVAGPMLLRTGKVRSKDEQCCSLGQMAGEKGYHCFSQFYAARMLYRNYNRAHNKKIVNLLKGKHDETADKLMRTFGQCVANRGAIFHKCCRYSSIQGNE